MIPKIPKAVSKNPFKDLRVQAGDVKRSMEWYKSQVKSLHNIERTVTKSLVGHQKGLTRSLTVGGLFLFQYDPKWKEELPYYDTLPLVFPFNKTKDGFLGINLHYLPYALRFKLMENLTNIQNSTSNENIKAEVSWKFLKSSSKFIGVEACVKRYLKEHLRSRFLQIKEGEWLAAAMMPLEQFQKADKNRVWSDSRRKVY